MASNTLLLTLTLSKKAYEGRLGTCLHCKSTFPQRSNKKYCSPKCRQYGNRVKQNSTNSPTTARDVEETLHSARALADLIYDLPTSEQLGFMRELIESARDGNTKLRRVLSNQYIRHLPKEQDWVRGHGSRDNFTISEMANRYCWRFWKANVTDVVYGLCEEPETGETT
jgi:hypothetical protein